MLGASKQCSNAMEQTPRQDRFSTLHPGILLFNEVLDCSHMFIHGSFVCLLSLAGIPAFQVRATKRIQPVKLVYSGYDPRPSNYPASEKVPQLLNHQPKFAPAFQVVLSNPGSHVIYFSLFSKALQLLCCELLAPE
jgi:hypothetical protein